MKLRHAAALALVSWYLMKPPLYVPWTGRVRQWLGYLPGDWEYDFDAPISKWSQVGEFESLDACHVEEERIADIARQDLTKSSDSQISKMDAANTSLLCVATDDPRLAK